MLYDFHTHSFLSDGVLLPSRLIRRAHVKGYDVIAVTDHAGPGNVEEVVDALRRECEVVNRYWRITALPGVELTHIPAVHPEVARRARAAGAAVINVHGETVVEPVEPGTNRAAIDCDEVDVLAHPGLLSAQDAGPHRRCRGCFLEVSARAATASPTGTSCAPPSPPAPPCCSTATPTPRRTCSARSSPAPSCSAPPCPSPSCTPCWRSIPADSCERRRAGGRWAGGGVPRPGNVQV